MGDPTAVKTSAQGDTFYMYVTDRNAFEYLSVFIDHNNVVEVHATRNTPGSGSAAALGVTLGAPEGTLASLATPDAQGLHPGADGLLYGFDAKDGIVHRISAGLPRNVQTALPPSPPAVPHGGTSFADAIVIGATNELLGVDAEYAYLDLNPCPGGGRWKLSLQALVNQSGKPYDRLDVICTTGGAKRSFYFDISRYFGKM